MCPPLLPLLCPCGRVLCCPVACVMVPVAVVPVGSLSRFRVAAVRPSDGRLRRSLRGGGADGLVGIVGVS